MTTDQNTADDQEQDPHSNHYTELRKVKIGMLKRHEQLKDGYPERAGEVMCALGAVEQLLNEWDKREDRDGHPERY